MTEIKLKKTVPVLNRYGWVRDTPDPVNDRAYMAHAPIPIPDLVDRRPIQGAIFDQGQLGSCTGNASIRAKWNLDRKKNPKAVPGSRLMAYYWARLLEKNTGEDAGAQIRDVVKGLVKFGACREGLWKYNIARFTEKPGSLACMDAARRQVTAYERVAMDPGQIRHAIAAGNDLVFGFSVFSSFEGPEVARTGKVPMPKAGEKNEGGHAVCAVGYNPAGLIVANSWGDGWGMAGFFELPWGFVTEGLANDAWVLTMDEG